MAGCGCGNDDAANLERRTLGVLLLINAVMFLVEIAAGWLAESTGLLADSLDMLADASVYGMALHAAGRSRRLQRVAARTAGVVQIGLAVLVLAEVARRYVYGSEPQGTLMMSVGAAAFAANVACLSLIAKHRRGEVHMRASWIFSVNDVIANVGVIVSGGLVRLVGSRLPDLVIGGLIAAVVLRGGVRILRDADSAAKSD